MNERDPAGGRGTVISRRDFLAGSTLALAGLTLGRPRATVAARQPALTAPPGSRIVSAAIYPAIGVSRVGNSDEWFLAPEVPGIAPAPDGGFKDTSGRVKKQVQRFRVYGYDDQGRVVRELRPDTGDLVTWKVHVANTKGAWYQFNSPMDMGRRTPGLTGQRRNRFFDGEARENLVIDPGEAGITGESARPVEMVGMFWQEPDRVGVKLGELRTDALGRLLVVPGDGMGASATPNNPIVSFSDNDGWYDDWCDGPVQATVRLTDGSELDAASAWVTACGPDFAPELHTFITLYDVVRDVMVNGKRFAGKQPLEPALGEKLSFLEEIYPLFHRLGQMEWLASASQLRQGWIDVNSFLDDDYMARLADPSPANRDFREDLFAQFRNPTNDHVDQYKLPYMLGSGVNYDSSPALWFQMPRLQYEILEKWAAGEFVDDLDRPEASIRTIDEVALEHQPAALTRAGLEPCSGGAFHPGVEMTWPLRQEALFRDDLPFRIALGDRASLLQNDQVGLLLTPETAFNRQDMQGDPALQSGEAYTFVPGPDAPIGPQMPGDLTRWMGLPWFGDAFSCGLAIEYANDFPNAIWWPAATPIDVLPELHFDQIGAEALSDDEQLRFFHNRVPWVRGVRGIGLHAEASYSDGLSRAVDAWSHLGFVVRRPRPASLSPELEHLIPDELFVEVDRGTMDLMTGEPPNRGPNAEPDAE